MNTANSPLNSKGAGVSYTLCTAFYIILSLAVGLILGEGGLNASSDAALYVSYLIAPVAMAAGCALTMHIFGQTFSDAVTLKCDWKYYIIALPMIFGLIFCVSNLNSLTLEFLKLLNYVPREESSYLPSLQGWRIIPALIVMAIIPAMAEEFFFRGVLFKNLQSSVGDIPAIFISGFCFALFHASPEQTVYQFVCGCAFAFITARSGSVLPAFLMHVLNNGFIIIVSACGGYILSETANIVLIAAGGVSFAASIILPVALKKPFSNGQKGEISKFFIYASVGIAALAVLWISAFFKA